MNTFLASLLLFAANDPVSGGNQWPGFRGTGASASAAKNLPVQWSESENIAWKVELPGYGQSAPVVWNGKVFLTAVTGDQRDRGFVVAYDAKAGKELWRHTFEPTQKSKWSGMISRAAPTPLVDAAAVYTFFEGGDLLALSHAGKQLWSRNLVKEYGEFKNNHGIGCSPVQTDDAIVILIDHKGPSYLLAIDKKTGKNQWKTERPERSSWTSPVVAERAGKPEIIVSSNGSVAGYDGRTGKQLWELEGLSGNTIPSASVSGQSVLIGAGLPRGAGEAKKSGKSNLCLELIEKDGKPSFEKCWTADKAVANYASPVAHRGHAYYINQVGIVFCLDLATGKELYSERLDGSCWATPIAAGDNIYFFGKDGRASVIKAGPTFEKVASNRLWNVKSEAAAPATEAPAVKNAQPEKKAGGRGEGGFGAEYLDPILYGVAAVDGAFFARTGTTLYRIGKVGE